MAAEVFTTTPEMMIPYLKEDRGSMTDEEMNIRVDSFLTVRWTDPVVECVGKIIQTKQVPFIIGDWTLTIYTLRFQPNNIVKYTEEIDVVIINKGLTEMDSGRLLCVHGSVCCLAWWHSQPWEIRRWKKTAKENDEVIVRTNARLDIPPMTPPPKTYLTEEESRHLTFAPKIDKRQKRITPPRRRSGNNGMPNIHRSVQRKDIFRDAESSEEEEVEESDDDYMGLFSLSRYIHSSSVVSQRPRIMRASNCDFEQQMSAPPLPPAPQLLSPPLTSTLAPFVVVKREPDHRMITREAFDANEYVYCLFHGEPHPMNYFPYVDEKVAEGTPKISLCKDALSAITNGHMYRLRQLIPKENDEYCLFHQEFHSENDFTEVELAKKKSSTRVCRHALFA